MSRTGFRVSIFCFAVVLGFAACQHTPVVEPLQTINTKDSLLVYIMAGQSNMAGRGLMEPQDTASNPRILMVDSIERLVIAREPLHYFYYPAFAGVDCGMSFAQSLLPFIPSGSRICLVPCAIGNTSLEQWLYDSTQGVKIYSNMLSRAQVAMQHGVLKGVLWHQGESNAEDSAASATYEVRLQALIQKFRHDVSDDQLPFFVGTLADFCPRPFKDSVNMAIRNVAGKLPNVLVISTDELTHKPDYIHFDAGGQREMGRRFAAVAISYLR